MDFTFAGILKPYQEKAVKDILSRDFGVLQAPTGSGKTVMALSLIAARRQPTLIICHSKELVSQWIERTEQFLDIPRAEIGIIGNGKMKIGEHIHRATQDPAVKAEAERVCMQLLMDRLALVGRSRRYA